MNQQVKLATATTLRYQPREGRPTSATITIKTKDDDDLITAVTAATATIDPVNTTVDAACGVSSSNPKQIKLAVTTGIRVDGIYLITDSTGRFEWVEVQSITAGDSVTVKDTLVYDYVSPNTFVGTELTYLLSAANAQTTSGECDSDYRAEWTYVVNSITYVRETLYDVTRHPWHRVATVAGLKKWNPDLFSLFDREQGKDWDSDLQAAFDRVIERVNSRGIPANAIVSMDALEIPTYCQLAVSKGMAGIMPGYAVQDPMAYLDMVSQQLTDSLDIGLRNVPWIDKDQDNAKTEDETGKQLTIGRLSL